MDVAPTLASLLPGDLALEVEAQARALGCDPSALVIEMVRGMVALRARRPPAPLPDIDFDAVVDEAWQRMGARRRSR